MFFISLALIFFIKISYAVCNIEVIYLPEVHTNKKDHEFQMKVIESLWKSGNKFVIAMEMFQQNFQRYLDEYVSGQIDEEEFLRKTQYKERWGYPEELYAPVWRFAREKGIKLYAIGLPSEVVNKIKAVGLRHVKDSTLPTTIVDPKPEEIERWKSVLKDHPRVDEKVFLDVQNAWDNSMAFAIANILKKENKKVVVLLGREHAPSLDQGVPYRLSVFRPFTSQKILQRQE